jgi:hypothetical protein
VDTALHEHADEVVGDEMDDEIRSFAAQDVQGHEDLDLVEVKFDAPALGVEGADGVGRVKVGIGRVVTTTTVRVRKPSLVTFRGG